MTDDERPFLAASTWRRLSVAEYVRRRTGAPLGGRASLRRMLGRSFGAASFAGFWQHWNPLVGYVLLRYVYAPLRRVLPAPVAVVATFIICGSFHDLVTIAVRQSFALFFTPWFLLQGIGVVVGQATRMHVPVRPRGLRTAVHTFFLGGTLALVLLLRRAAGVP